MVSSKEVIAPPPAPPVSYFRGNEFDLGAFATYVTGTNGGGSVTSRTIDGETVTLSSSGSPYGWGGGMDFTYFFICDRYQFVLEFASALQSFTKGHPCSRIF